MQIYLIANKINGKNYVGQTIWNFNTRYSGGHWEKFSHNKHLKNAAKKYGVDNFEVKILREGNFSPKELDILEDFYIKEFNSLVPNGYNNKEAGKTGRNYYNYKEYELHDSLGTVYKIINLSQFCKKNNLNYGAMLNMVSGINISSQGYALSSTPIDLIVNPNETWELEYIPTKQIITIKRKDILNFCKQYNLKTSSVYRLINKKTYVTNKWKLKSTILSGRIREDTVKYKNVCLSHKDGRSIVVNNVYKFCKDNNLERCVIYKLIKKEAIEHLGWRLSSVSDAKEERCKRLGVEVEIKNVKTNQILKIKNISDFCRKNDLNVNVMFSMIRGDIKQYLGWTVPDRDLSNYTPPKKIIYIKMIHFDGSVVETDNAKKLETEYKICTKQTIYEIIRGNAKNLIRGWKIVNVKFLKNYYPEINFP